MLPVARGDCRVSLLRNLNQKENKASVGFPFSGNRSEHSEQREGESPLWEIEAAMSQYFVPIQGIASPFGFGWRRCAVAGPHSPCHRNQMWWLPMSYKLQTWWFVYVVLVSAAGWRMDK